MKTSRFDPAKSLIFIAGRIWGPLGVKRVSLVLDTGAGYELKVNRFWAIMTLVGSLAATAITWYLLIGVGK